MRRGEFQLIIGVLVLIALALTLRHDLAMLSWRQGNDSIRSGDYRAALASLRKAGRTEFHARQIAFNAGVACYRLGEFQQAREQFAAASASDDPGVRAAALFNMGNCDFRQGERLAATDRNASRRRFQQAAEEYGKALAIASDAADVRHNLSLVRNRLSDLLKDAGATLPSPIERR